MLSYILIILGLVGLVTQNKDLLGFLLVVEVIFFGLSLQSIAIGGIYNNIVGQVGALIIITIAAADIAVGLGLLVLVHRVLGGISYRHFSNLHI